MLLTVTAFAVQHSLDKVVRATVTVNERHHPMHCRMFLDVMPSSETIV